MSINSIPRVTARFETTIKVAGATVAPDQYSECVVIAFGDDGERVLTPEAACALAAALQAVAVHQLEQDEAAEVAA